MVDRLSREQRSDNMSRIRNRDTRPEIRVRKILHRLGYRFRLNARELPGTPDIVLPKHRSVVFIHGCFWHRHAGCKYAYMPKTRIDFWSAKFTANLKRDAKAVERLRSDGWRILILWECETKDDKQIEEAIHRFFREGEEIAT
ncbi:DNA mismatch endonuclease Vsr [Sinorhizobium meliloti]|uniref:very short patch repair endonuclease n=1 Tax=Rhizobium meliloti TaxID=382 RepID=UPI000B4A2D37|nr:DNA mismatch endonuclease Vsr [Sinorhizobium meliloti]ASP97027.1 very short patch repair endonuclease [Sinorhizobium meliloti]MDW9702930.1 DNA mismatch endonuclease Vsr [Sinorhizobium meliloti]MDW9932237.1 DNA mismatch endonuclease Vsr [Sinorhizobium meliloti]MDX0099056.1 DNA mismatch endonuclease Vsr [Sinorhizobium meliloti]MDX0117969.1 DNA mismatch endonuclease Vsr [Sinorhizobium meliloti]